MPVKDDIGKETGGSIRLPDHLYGAMSTDRRPLNDNRIYRPDARYGARRSPEDGGRPEPVAAMRRASLPKALRVAAPRREAARLPHAGWLRAGAASLGIGLALWLVFIALAAALYPEVWSQVPGAALQAVWQ